MKMVSQVGMNAKYGHCETTMNERLSYGEDAAEFLRATIGSRIIA